ncbi:TetR/AcrR family transcriptional regulator [Ktedonosporobacter rubrisoli]|uniref:TetR/AcrR family transcriptional regulator n=1 Tax=Ktedonosporobacter rubrisoli TaxID=2509675 RepID=A0A4P6JUP5_KTERU|nr:TetR/AcrR family transcriptional regulator [Ktedonosporobacter rubrisoli]QBD79063.1 TetR/AcrR family transcriptional regulator [Ktedonosporobacter rubrisoli]
MGRKERRQREQQELRQSIMDAAREIALAEGWRNVTMRKIAERIEYSHPAIYDYFENKDVLLLELVHEGFRLLELELQTAQARASNATEKLFLIGQGYFTFARRYPELYRVMFGLDGATFSISEPEKEGLQIGKIATEAVMGVLEEHNWSTQYVDEEVNILWSTAHGLVTLAMVERLPGDQVQQLFDRTVQNMMLAWEHGSASSTVERLAKE